MFTSIMIAITCCCRDSSSRSLNASACTWRRLVCSVQQNEKASIGLRMCNDLQTFAVSHASDRMPYATHNLASLSIAMSLPTTISIRLYHDRYHHQQDCILKHCHYRCK